jgi:hypothetical protein
VDVWNMNPGKGTVTKTKIYTEASDPKPPSRPVEGEEFYPPSAREALRKARAEGKSQPPLAPFAQDFLAQELEAERAAGKAAAVTEAAAAPEVTAEEIDKGTA